MVPHWLIEKKRDGGALSEVEIRFFIDGFTAGEIPDYQMAAMAMAIYFQGMTPEETVALTRAMMESGDLVDTSAIHRPKFDKHSTGGIGDKVSLVLAPMVAACGVAVPMISGRGLGITGGTLDKLESIPGYRTDLTEREFVATLQACGCSIIGQTGRLAPADKKLYALRDVTATVPSIPLIVASIMSKKLAEGIDGLVLDVKWGSGAFMATRERARELAAALVSVGRGMGKKADALLTGMNQPLGRTAGNALEVRESIEALRGEGAADLMEVTTALGARMLTLAGVAPDLGTAIRTLERTLADGEALAVFREMVRLHGGDPAVVDDPSKLPTAALVEAFPALRTGHVAAVDAGEIGRACVVLGAGRRKSDDGVDPAVGVSDLVKVGDPVDRGDRLLTLHANDRASLDEARRHLERAFRFRDEPVAPPPLLGDSPAPSPEPR